MRLRFILILMFSALTLIHLAQENIDSLRLVVGSMPDDSSKAKNYITIAKSYLGGEDSYKALPYLLKGSEVAEKCNFIRGKTICFGYLGSYYYSHSNLTNAVKFWLQAAKYAEELKDHRIIASLNNNLGLVYLDQNRYDLAGHYLQIGLKMRIEKDQHNELSGSFNNMGLLYFKKGHVETREEFKKKFFDSSEYYYNKAISIRKEKQDSMGLAGSYGNLATLMNDHGKFDNAIQLGKNSLAMYKKLDSPYDVITCQLDLGEIYFTQKKFKEAMQLGQEALDGSETYESPDLKKCALTLLTRCYAKAGQYEKAHECALEIIQLNDTMFSTENSRQVNEMNAVYETEKKETENKLLAAKNQLQEKTISDHESRKKYLYLIIALSAIAAVAVLIAFTRSRSVNKKLSKFNHQISLQKEEIEKQKEIVEEKNKEVLDSITYAGKIQNAILPEANEFEKYGLDAFILFKPRDIISGDFFWILKQDDFLFYATADCTGHGVPGALMSMLGASLLNEIIIEKGITEPGDVLDLMRLRIIRSLKQQGKEGENKDGMDMVLSRIDLKTKSYVFSAAQNPVWVITENNFNEYTGDKQPVGITPGEPRQFNQTTLELKKGETVYTFTDGFADQFGGPKGKKFKYKQLQNLLQETIHLPMAERKNVLENSFNTWKGNLEQVDDVLIIGVKS